MHGSTNIKKKLLFFIMQNATNMLYHPKLSIRCQLLLRILKED